MSSPLTTNSSLADEIEAIRAIFDPETIKVVSHSTSNTLVHLQPPSQPFTFILSFPSDYPDVPPSVDATASVGDTAKGDGDDAVTILADVLGTVYQPGQVCLFELISDAAPILEGRYGAHTPPAPVAVPHENPRSAARPHLRSPAARTLTDEAAAAAYPPPQWTTSEPLTVMKSTFVAHATACSSKDEALAHLASLVRGSKKIAAATHNISAYRVRLEGSGERGAAAYVQDCDDDGESAAGGRLLHLLQLMECEDVLVVVTRWYGGVKLGGERFRCIGNVARECLVKGGWGKKDEKKK